MQNIVAPGKTVRGIYSSGWPDRNELYHIGTLVSSAREAIRKPAIRLPFEQTADKLQGLLEAWLKMPDEQRSDAAVATMRQARSELIAQVRAFFVRQSQNPFRKGMENTHFNGLPAYDEDGLLATGVYHAQWEEFAERFSFTERRNQQRLALLAALNLAKKAGGRTATVGGSFVTAKEKPIDIDLKLEKAELDVALLEPMLHSCDHRCVCRGDPWDWQRRRRPYFGLDLGFASGGLDLRTFLESPPKEFGPCPSARAVGVVQLDLTRPLPVADGFVPFSMFDHNYVYEKELAELRARLPEHWAHISDAMLEFHLVRIIRPLA